MKRWRLTSLILLHASIGLNFGCDARLSAVDEVTASEPLTGNSFQPASFESPRDILERGKKKDLKVSKLSERVIDSMVAGLLKENSTQSLSLTETSSLSEAEVEILRTEAAEAIIEAGLGESEELIEVMRFAYQGALESLTSEEGLIETAEAPELVEAMAVGLMSSLSEEAEYLVYQASDAEEDPRDSAVHMIGEIAVSKLEEVAVDQSSVSVAIAEFMAGVVSSIGATGAAVGDLPSLIGSLQSGAMKSVMKSMATSDRFDVLKEAVSSISRGALLGLKEINIEGIDPQAVEGLGQSVVEGAKQILSNSSNTGLDVSQLNELKESAATGAYDAIASLQETVESSSPLFDAIMKMAKTFVASVFKSDEPAAANEPEAVQSGSTASQIQGAVLDPVAGTESPQVEDSANGNSNGQTTVALTVEDPAVLGECVSQDTVRGGGQYPGVNLSTCKQICTEFFETMSSEAYAWDCRFVKDELDLVVAKAPEGRGIDSKPVTPVDLSKVACTTAVPEGTRNSLYQVYLAKEAAYSELGQTGTVYQDFVAAAIAWGEACYGTSAEELNAAFGATYDEMWVGMGPLGQAAVASSNARAEYWAAVESFGEESAEALAKKAVLDAREAEETTHAETFRFLERLYTAAMLAWSKMMGF